MEFGLWSNKIFSFMVGKYQKENNLKVPEKLTVINVMGRVYKLLATCTQDFKCMKFGF